MFWGPATIFFPPNSNICRDCHLMLWLSKKDLAPKGMKPLRRQVVGQLLHSADCSSPWKVTQSLFLQWNDVNKAHLWFSKSICLCLQKNFKRKKERGEGGREEGKGRRMGGRSHDDFGTWSTPSPAMKLNNGNFIQNGTRRPEEGAPTHYHSSQRPQQEETYPAFPAESVYFTIPAGERKTSPYPATNPANGNHCKSGSGKPSPPWILASSDGLSSKARIPAFSFVYDVMSLSFVCL